MQLLFLDHGAVRIVFEKIYIGFLFVWFSRFFSSFNPFSSAVKIAMEMNKRRRREVSFVNYS